MKFSFEADQYRKNLADKLKEKRAENKDEAKELLTNEKEMKRYVIAKDIKRVSDEIRKVKIGGDSAEEGTESKELDVEIETFDLSDIMPEEMKIYFDTIRLKELKESNEGRSLVEFEKKYPIKGEYHIYDDNDAIGYRDDHMYSKWSESKIEQKKKEYDAQAELREKIQKFITEITDGAYLNPEMLIHVVGACIEPEFVSLRHPHKGGSGEPKEKLFDPTKGGITKLFFSVGKPWDMYKTSRKPLVIVNPKSDRFQKNIADKPELNKKIEEEMQVFKERSSRTEVIVEFNNTRSWADIADWIVDLYHSRLYKITEKEKSENENL